MVLSSAIVCDHDRTIAGDRRSVFPYDRRRSQNFLRSAICDCLRSYGNQPLAHSISDPRAEISGILVMVRRSSTTSRGTTYWFHCFCFPMSRLSALRMRNFYDLICLPKSRETKAVNNEGKDKLDPRSQVSRLSTGYW